MADAKRGDFVQIHKVILEPDERADGLPSCTKSVPYEGYIKGFLADEEADLGDTVKIGTFIGRAVSGTLHKVNPTYDHNFGVPQQTLLSIGEEGMRGLKKLKEQT